MTVLDVDGSDWADFLRFRMNDKIDERMSTEQSWLLTNKERFAELMVGNTVYKKEAEEQAKQEFDRHVQHARLEERRRHKRKNPLKFWK